ncbi:MAG: EamA family transporter [Betaproteobacteria bacterium HGW-Betaproteobacteria-3]|jgi:drug/metabolite transporter (DMT)-like permease|nr:MAG: EamA family transporter [Betaproteobacteria bacterium HGW-Betaproteobacteria-3]
MSANAFALGAIALWATLAALGVSLSHVPPFLLTGLALVVGSVLALPLSRFDLRQWRVPPATLAMGVYGLFGFHFLLFIALRHAPPVQANLVNYLWPLGIVVMAPLFLPGVRLSGVHWLAAITGFAGAAVAITGGHMPTGGFAWGYIPALGSAFIWASYSLMTRRVPAFPTSAIGGFALVSGLLSLGCHALLEPSVSLSLRDWALIAVMGLGPLGAAFFLWDAALKRGDARHIGLLSFLTPLLSTVLLLVVRGERPGLAVAVAAALIVGAAVLGTRARADVAH